MPHTQSIQADRVWDHLHFSGRRTASPETSRWSINYGQFASQSDADAYPASQPRELSGEIGVKGSLLDEHFYYAPSSELQAAITLLQTQLQGEQLAALETILADLPSEGYLMSDARVFGCLAQLLTGEFTQAELDSGVIGDLVLARDRMKGTEFKVNGVTVFTVTPLVVEE